MQMSTLRLLCGTLGRFEYVVYGRLAHKQVSEVGKHRLCLSCCTSGVFLGSVWMRVAIQV